MLADENPDRGAVAPSGTGRSMSIMLYTDDVDAVFKRAVDAGAKSIEAPADMFWGDRMGHLMDPFGHQWAIATHKEDVSPAEMEKRMAAIGS
jgi:PhnB protein